MNAALRRGGTFVDDAGRTVVWSVAEGRRGRRWRWTVGDRRGNALATHTLETSPAAAFSRLESACGSGLLTLHREADGSIHGNRVTDRGVDHLVIPSPAPALALVGSAALGVGALISGLGDATEGASFDAIEVLDDLGVRVVECTVRRREDGTWEVRSGRRLRRTALDLDGLPAGSGASWSLEEA